MKQAEGQYPMKTICSWWASPLALLAVLLVSFGLLIPWLGFYWDDWPVILTGQTQGAAGFREFYRYDRPFSAWTYIVTYPLFGSRPLPWHLFSLLLRWGSASVLLWALTRLWPNHRRETACAAFLFAVYPVFTQQSISVAYSQHWICTLLFFFSLGAMLQGGLPTGGSRRYWAWTAAALAASLLQLLTMEYYAGLELVRPALLWILAAGQFPDTRQRARAVLLGWLPYLLGLGIFVTWRFFFLEFPGEEANPPILLARLLSDPVEGALRLAEIAVPDSAHLLLSTWTEILAPAGLRLTDRFYLFSWAAAGLAAGVTGWFLTRRLGNRRLEQPVDGAAWPRQALLVGALAVAFGMLPVWATDRQIIVGMYSNRFGLPAMFGASLILVALMELLIGRPAQRVILVSLLVGLAAGQHLRTANDYRWAWVKQTRFYWQMSWRAPVIQPGTAVFSDGEIFPYVGLYSTSAGINLLYTSAFEESQRLPYWFYSLGREFGHVMGDFRQGMPLKTAFRHYTFEGSTRDGVVLFYEPETNDCLHVLGPEDAAAPGLPGITAQALSAANPDRILSEPVGPDPNRAAIFGEEPEHGWCYLYQKAALAGQTGDWQAAAALGDQAEAQGFHPLESGSNTAFEWMPFIEGYARSGDLEKARSLSLEVYARDARIDARLCGLWDELAEVLPENGERDRAAAQVRETLQCP